MYIVIKPSLIIEIQNYSINSLDLLAYLHQKQQVLLLLQILEPLAIHLALFSVQRASRDFQYQVLALLSLTLLTHPPPLEPSINLIINHNLDLLHPRRNFEHLLAQPSHPKIYFIVKIYEYLDIVS